MRILLVSTYELGHQPLGLAVPAAALRAAGHKTATLDLAVDAPDPAAYRAADLVAFSIPMHTATRLAIEAARGVRQANPAAHIAFYGLYALTVGDQLREADIADTVIGGEPEPGLLALASDLAIELPTAAFPRQQFPVPDRSSLHALDRYAAFEDASGEKHLAGYVEASRGCAHLCTHCPLTPVYNGRLRLVQQEAVLADIEQLVAAGARHITFGDPDFLNAVPHSLAIARELHARHPGVTFDATIKVEHLREHEDLLPELHDLGCAFITSAFESLDDAVLARLEKGHTRADIAHVVASTRAAGIPVRPTWVPFTPWTTPTAFLDILEFVEATGMVGAVLPVQFALRLLLPPGSPLIEITRAEGLLGDYDPAALSYDWRYQEPASAALQQEAMRIVEAAADAGDCCAESVETTFAKLKTAALKAAGRPGDSIAPPLSSPVPGLTEAWFCCAEPTAAQLAPLEEALGV